MKNTYFKRMQVAACAAVLLMLSSCIDPLEMDSTEANVTSLNAKYETTTTKPRKRGTGSQDDEIGSMIIKNSDKSVTVNSDSTSVADN